ncbi:MAG: hypothetical protein ACOCXG_05605 [Nanoarchaeota archaeon]
MVSETGLRHCIAKLRNLSLWQILFLSFILWIGIFFVWISFVFSEKFCLSCYLSGKNFVTMILAADLFLIPLTLLLMKDFFKDLEKMSESPLNLIKYGSFYFLMGFLSFGALIVSILVLGKFS